MNKVSVYDCSFVELPKIEVVARKGNLTFAYNNEIIPFDVKRVFYTYDIPANMKVDYKPPIAPDHVLVAGNLSLMTGVTALPLADNEELSFLPESLSGLTKEEQASIVEHFKAKVASEADGKKVKNMKFKFTTLYGRDCLTMDFEDKDSHILLHSM